MGPVELFLPVKSGSGATRGDKHGGSGTGKTVPSVRNSFRHHRVANGSQPRFCCEKTRGIGGGARTYQVREENGFCRPLIYRFYELVMVNGPKALIEEEFGDGIMSAMPTVRAGPRSAEAGWRTRSYR